MKSIPSIKVKRISTYKILVPLNEPANSSRELMQEINN